MSRWRPGRKTGFPIYWVRRQPNSSLRCGPQQPSSVGVFFLSPGSCRKPSTVASDDLRAILFKDHHGQIDVVVEQTGRIFEDMPF